MTIPRFLSTWRSACRRALTPARWTRRDRVAASVAQSRRTGGLTAEWGIQRRITR